MNAEGICISAIPTRSWTVLLLLAVVMIGCSTDRSSQVEVKARYAQMKRIVYSDLRGLPFEEFASKAGINRAIAFDELYDNQRDHSRRVYHFEGFALDVIFEERDGKLFSDPHFFPALYWDGLTRQQRMAKYQQGLSDYFSERQRRLEADQKLNE